MFRYTGVYMSNEKGKVLHVQGNVDAENRNMVIKTPNGRKTQVWYFHQLSKTIRTRLNN
jgi:hypothetical protein